MMVKKNVFISHITEEKEIAQELKKLVESSFLGMIEVFVSSDGASIRRGQRWLEGITNALKKCDVEIILASPESVKRPWVNFEAGAGWIREIPVIPICHSGMTPSKLPPPLGTLQASVATDENELKLIFPVLADAIGCNLPPHTDFSSFINVVRTFEKTSRLDSGIKAATQIAPTNGLASHEFHTLVQIAKTNTIPGSSIDSTQILTFVEGLGFTKLAASLALHMLARKGLVQIGSELGEWDVPYSVVGMTHEGWAWLNANQDQLILSSPPRHFDEFEDAYGENEPDHPYNPGEFEDMEPPE